MRSTRFEVGATVAPPVRAVKQPAKERLLDNPTLKSYSVSPPELVQPGLGPVADPSSLAPKTMRPSALRWRARGARTVLLVLAGLLVGGCAKKDASKFVVGFSQMESDNPWRLAETKSLKDEAAKRGVQLVVTDAQ